MIFTPTDPVAGSLGLVIEFQGDEPLAVQFAPELAVDLTFIPALVGPQGPPGADGAPGSGGSTYSETFAANTLWVVNHNLGRYPSCTIRSAGGEVVQAETLHVSANQVRVTFETAFAGSIYCV